MSLFLRPRAERPKSMATESSTSLHLPSLKITGFRGLDRLSIPRLGRVTLLAGHNGAGKTTVLEAVRLFASRGRPRVLWEMLTGREELATGLDEDRDPIVLPDLSALFHERGGVQAKTIQIDGGDEGEGLRLEASSPAEWTGEQQKRLVDLPVDADVQALRIGSGDWSETVPWFFPGTSRGFPPHPGRYLPGMRRRLFDESEWPEAIGCESMGPGRPDNEHLARLWDDVSLTEDEDFVVGALQLLPGIEIDRVTVVGSEGAPRIHRGRRVIVRSRRHARRVPLKRLGDGATRLFGAALALANGRNGILLMDEAENGLHHSVHERFWRMVLQAAHAGDVQVLATTHSWDCIAGFARAAAGLAEIDGVLVRLELGDEGCRTVFYSEDELKIAADRRIEVR